MDTVRRAIQKLGMGLLAIAALALVDAHLMVLQSVAWARMFHAFVQHETIAEALRDTLDGDHPCKMCCAIKSARNSAHASIAAAPTLRLDAMQLPEQGTLWRSTPALERICVYGEAIALFSPPPEVPPPRSNA